MSNLIRMCSRNLTFSAAFSNFRRGLQTHYYVSNSENLTDGADLIKRRKLSSQHLTKTDFRSVFPDIIRDMTEIINGYKHYEASARLTRAVEYNMKISPKNLLGFSLLTYKHLVKDADEENLRLAYIWGWSIEILNTCALMFDDIMDNSSHRRGLPCWHTLEDDKLLGLNDGFMIENAVYAVLKKYFQHQSCYPELLELVHEATFIACGAEALDMVCANHSVNSFNLDTYNILSINKVAYDHFLAPITGSMILAGIKDQKALAECRPVVRDIGRYYQIQNDFQDCFGTLETAGKLGTDIQDNKYSWLATVCMESVNYEQKQVMLDCYGKNDLKKAQKVKELYKTLDLPGVFASYEKEFYKSTEAKIMQMSNNGFQLIFLEILNKMCQCKT